MSVCVLGRLGNRSPPHGREEKWDALVVGEGGVRGADRHGEQQHVVGLRLSCQRGEQVLRFLATHSKTGLEPPHR